MLAPTTVNVLRTLDIHHPPDEQGHAGSSHLGALRPLTSGLLRNIYLFTEIDAHSPH